MDQLTHWLHTIIDSLSPFLTKGWALFNDYTYLRAVILIIISYFFAKFISKHIPQLMITLAKKIKFEIGEKISKLSQPLIFKICLLSCIGVIAHFSLLTETQHFIAIASIKSLTIIFILLFIYNVIEIVLEHLCNKNTNNDETTLIQPATLPLFKNILLLLIVLIGVHQVFGVWDIDMTALLASAGIVGLAVGMASKDTLSDVIAGILILTDAPYHVGDVIQIGENIGTITSIGIRSTRIITKDNVGITVPNGKMGSSAVVNESTADDTSLRIKLLVQAAYGVDPETIRKIMMSAAKETGNVIQDKKIAVTLADVQQHQVTFSLLCWIPQPGLKSSTLSTLREKIYLHFLRDNIAITLPEKRDLQRIEITTVPELTQSLVIKEMPDRNSTISIKEIPDLFGTGQARNLREARKPQTGKKEGDEYHAS